jgi:predicted ATPase/class 3 adenylate cyclase
VAVSLPTGTVTFLFTDIEGSTRLLQELGEGYRRVLDDHTALMRKAIAEGDGVEIGTEGDSFFAVFPTATGAVRASAAAQRSLAAHDWAHGKPLRVRMGLHTGEGVLGGDNYLGIDVNRAARIAAAAHGGQVLLSGATRVMVEHALPEGVALRDLGAHRLKDIVHPESLHDLLVEGLPSEFPPPRTLEVPTNLPMQLTSFVGRERELGRIRELLEHSRLVTLTGPGGTGKTRLALQAASDLLDRFPDGVFFVELTPVSESDLVPRAIAAALGLREEGSAHATSMSRPIVDTLTDHLRNRTTLLVLDNFEQVLEAAPIVGRILSVASRLRILATSRAALHLQGEQEFSVAPLGVPDSDLSDPREISRHEAVALFVERAAASDPAFELTGENSAAVAQICARLDGLPLAIELAASRIRLLTPEEILDRLDRRLSLLTGGPRDLPERQQTLRGAIAWSHDLLHDAARAFFRRLSVFVGGWAIPAAEAVCNPDAEIGIDALGGLSVLLDNSLIRRKETPNEEVRFDMLQTIREYGLELLDAGEEGAAIRTRHAEHFLALAEEAEPHLRAPKQDHWLDLLEIEHDNLRAAVGWAIDADEAEIGMRLVGALWRFWHLRGYLAEGRRWADDVLALPKAERRTALRAKAVSAAGSLAYWQNDLPPVRRAYEEALAIYRELGDASGVAEGTYNMAYVHALAREVPKASEKLQTSHAQFRELGDRRGEADALWVLALVARFEGDLQLARSRAEESLRLHRELGDRFGMTMALQMLGRVALEVDDLDTARTTFLETMAMHEHMGNRTGITIALDNLAAREIALGNLERAVRLGGASQAIKESAGGQAPPELIDHPDPRGLARGSLVEESIARAWEEGRGMSLEEAVAYAREGT